LVSQNYLYQRKRHLINILWLDVDGTTTHEFREGATFESHEDEGEGNKEGHAFEWAGAFELTPGQYKWTFAKVGDDYADPKMKMVFLSSGLTGAEAIEASKEVAQELLESGSETNQVHGDVLTPNANIAYQLVFDSNKKVTEYRIVIKKKGVYVFFTEHMPFEFEADEHFLKDIAKVDVEPIAQEPDSGHHHHHGSADPHAWLDPENAKVWVQKINEVLSTQDPRNSQVYANNTKQAIASLDGLIEMTSEKVNSLNDPKFIVFHDAYQYFEKRFGISATGSISLSDAQDPSPARIQEIRGVVKKLGVNCIFIEPQYNPGIVKNVFDSVNVTTGVMDPLGASLTTGTGHYRELIKGMVGSLSQCKK